MTFLNGRSIFYDDLLYMMTSNQQFVSYSTISEKALKELAKRGHLIQISDHRFYLPNVLNRIATQVAAMAKTSPFTVREFRDSTGIGRNVAIDILEYFDSRGFTRREENQRKLLRNQL